MQCDFLVSHILGPSLLPVKAKYYFGYLRKDLNVRLKSLSGFHKLSARF